jgi:hypothetical protein
MDNIQVLERNPFPRGVQGESQQIISRLNLRTCVRGISWRVFYHLGQARRSMAKGMRKLLEQEYFPTRYIWIERQDTRPSTKNDAREENIRVRPSHE